MPPESTSQTKQAPTVPEIPLSGPAEEGPIRISVADTRERKRRQRELWMAVAAVIFIVALSWVELKFFGLGSHLFLFLFNFNFLLLLVVLGAVVQSVVRLTLERRRKVLGSKLRTRMVMAFVLLSLIPTLVLFFISVKFVQTSVDFWFQNRVEESMEEALKVGQAFHGLSRQRLERRAEHIVAQAARRKLAWGSPKMKTFLSTMAEEHDLGIVGHLAPESLAEEDWIMAPEWRLAWPKVKANLNWAALAAEPKWRASVVTTAGTDLVVGLAPLDGGSKGWLVLGENIGLGLSAKLTEIVSGLEEFKKLKALKYPLKVALYLTLGVMTLLIILGAIFFGFRLAGELMAPLQALAEGTRRVAQGDLSVRLMDQSGDELGSLVQSFNTMAADLEQGRRQLEQQNRELDDRGRYMEAVLNNVTSGVVSLDPKGRVSTVNRAAEAMLGLDRRELVGKSPLQLLYGECAELVGSILEQFEQGGPHQWQRQMRLKLGGRVRTYLVNVVPLTTDEGRQAGLVAVFEDVGEVEKMQRLAAWREVARRIAHEIKNPLTPIKLSAQRLERKFGPKVDDQVFSESTALIVRQVEQMQQMVTEFSAFAKLPEVVLKPGKLGPLLQEVVALFRVSHKEIDWTLRGEETMPLVAFDAEGMRRVFINVLTNSVEALESVHEGQKPSVRIEVSHDLILERVFIEVADNGPGLSDEERSRMFEPYFSRKKGGTGLGLTIVNSIISDHGGYVRVRQGHPVGTVLVIELPVAEA